VIAEDAPPQRFLIGLREGEAEALASFLRPWFTGACALCGEALRFRLEPTPMVLPVCLPCVREIEAAAVH
jgi:hypothetical protein